MDLGQVQAGFDAAGLPTPVTQELLREYSEVKRRYHLRDHRPTEVGAGRFAEAALRLIEYELFGNYTPLSKSLPSLTTQRLAQFESSSNRSESLRIHIPRALYSVYAVRNKRDAAHLNDGIDPNLQDATYVVGVLDWVLAEVVRIHHSVSPAVAQATIDDLVTREVPVIEEIDGQPVLSKDLNTGDKALVFLYRAGRDLGLDLHELQRQMRHNNRSNLLRSVKALDVKGLVLIHPNSGRAHITSQGIVHVEANALLRPA